MNVTDIQKVLNALNVVAKELGDEASIRQVNILLQVALSGAAGTDALTLQNKTQASQAAVSRTLKLLSVEHKLVEFFLDPADGRLRLTRICPKGAAMITRMIQKLT